MDRHCDSTAPKCGRKAPVGLAHRQLRGPPTIPTNPASAVPAQLIVTRLATECLFWYLNAFNFQTHSLEPVNQFVAFGHYLVQSECESCAVDCSACLFESASAVLRAVFFLGHCSGAIERVQAPADLLSGRARQARGASTLQLPCVRS